MNGSACCLYRSAGAATVPMTTTTCGASPSFGERASLGSPSKRCGLCSRSPPEGQRHAQAQAFAEAHLRDMRAKIADLERMADVLTDTVAACEAGSHAGCLLLETLAAP